MVGTTELNSHFIDYATSTKSSGDRRETVSIHDSDNATLEVECVLTDGELTEVYFLNNQFYELASERLLQVAMDIVEGNYRVKSNLFRSKQWIAPNSINDGPERIAKSDPMIYRMLPKAFSKK